jgi:hypothetical protein
VLKKHFNLHPYKKTARELKEGDSGKSGEYCRWFRDVITANGEDILDVTFFTDGACFHLSGYAKQCSRVWSATNSHEIKDAPLHDQKVGEWGAISRNRIIGTIFFGDVINLELYCEVILCLFIGYLNGDKTVLRIVQ